jgi:hypothetical protein
MKELNFEKKVPQAERLGVIQRYNIHLLIYLSTKGINVIALLWKSDLFLDDLKSQTLSRD